MVEPQTGTYPPQQQRTREQLARAIAAGVELLEVGDYERFTMAEVAARADVSVTSLYRRFENKDALFHAVHVAALQEIQEMVDELFGRPFPEDLTDADLVESVVQRTSELFFRHRGKIRVMYLRGAVNAEVHARGGVSSERFGEAVMAALLIRRSSFGHPDPELAAEMCFRVVYAAMMQWVTFGATFEVAHDPGWQTFVDQQSAMCANYLLREQF